MTALKAVHLQRTQKDDECVYCGQHSAEAAGCCGAVGGHTQLTFSQDVCLNGTVYPANQLVYFPTKALNSNAAFLAARKN